MSGVIQDGWSWAIAAWGVTVAALVVYTVVLEVRLNAARKEQG